MKSLRNKIACLVKIYLHFAIKTDSTYKYYLQRMHPVVLTYINYALYPSQHNTQRFVHINCVQLVY
jgi:hypothetical protein